MSIRPSDTPVPSFEESLREMIKNKLTSIVRTLIPRRDKRVNPERTEALISLVQLGEMIIAPLRRACRSIFNFNKD